MEIKIKIDKSDLGFYPKQVKSLVSKLGEMKKSRPGDDLEVHLDFEREDTNELSIAIIWKQLQEYKKIPCNKSIKYRGRAEEYLDERHFFDSLTGKKSSIFSASVPINYETFNPVRPTRINNQNDELNRIFEDSTKGVLDFTNEFDKEIRIHMTECLQNSFDHSESDPNKAAGAVCSLSDNKIIDFCVVDMGQGIRNSFLSNPHLKLSYAPMTDVETIIRSTDKNISCNPVKFPNPTYTYGNAGIGLYYLNQFVKMHPGSSLVIISGKGYFYNEYLGREPKIASINSGWPGTIVYFRIKLGQEKSEQYKALTAQFVTDFDNR